MPVNGVILLGYARSAGSGDQAVPGVVTSRRDRGALKKQQEKKQQEQEEGRKTRQRQEIAAQYLKRKWKEQDEKKKRKDRDGGASPERRPTRQESDDDESEQRSPEPAEAPEGKWVSKEDAYNLARAAQADVSKRDAPRPLPITGLKEPEQRGFLPHPPQKAAAAVVTMDPVVQQKRKKALANAFGLDDDDGEAQRELELAARIKRQRLPPGPLSSQPGASGSGPTNAEPAASSRPTDMFEQLRQLAEWKRKCKGNRIPMPDSLVKAIGGTAGLQHSGEQQTLGRSPGDIVGNRPRARSPSAGGSRRFVDKKKSRSRSRRRRSRS